MTRKKRKRGNTVQVASCALAGRVLWVHSVRPLLEAGLNQEEAAKFLNRIGLKTIRGKRWSQVAIAKLKSKYSQHTEAA